MKMAFFTRGENNVLLAFLYIPPDGTRYSNEEHFDVIETDILEFSNNDDDILIAGYFNVRTILYSLIQTIFILCILIMLYRNIYWMYKT